MGDPGLAVPVAVWHRAGSNKPSGTIPELHTAETVTYKLCLFPDGPGWVPIGRLPSGAPVYVNMPEWEDPFDVSDWLGTLKDSPWLSNGREHG